MGGASDGCESCQLTAVQPSLANTNDIIMLEGTFTDAVSVSFPGGATVPATVLGTHRARVAVPAAATQGNLAVTSGSMMVGSLPFRRASFSLGLGQFTTGYEQETSARQNSALETARANHTSVAIDNHLYVIGGTGSNGSLISVEHASINADGSLGLFQRVSGVNLVTARHAHSMITIRNNVYIFGGRDSTALLSIERATIGTDRTLSTFSTLAGVTLVTARYGHACAIVGNYLYILGGFGNTALDSIERAVINTDGSLGAFVSVPGISLTMARYGHKARVVGNYLYVIGGTRGNSSLRDVERATINSDGTLGDFTPVPSASLMTERAGHTVEVLGNHLYVVGGASSNGIHNTVEFAPLSDTGSLGSFALLPEVTLTTARRNHTTTIIGNYIYDIGGYSNSLLNTVERSVLNTGGTLGPFAIVPGLTKPRERASPPSAVLGNYIYLIGGSQFLTNLTSIDRASVSSESTIDAILPIDSINLLIGRSGHALAVLRDHLYALGGFGVNGVERTSIGMDGSLGTFTPIPGTEFTVERFSFTASIIDNYLYAFGGRSSGFLPLNSIERSNIGADGSLAAFAVVRDVTLATARFLHTSVRIANFIYILGGTDLTITNSNPPLSSIERATISSEGSIGPFVLLSNVKLATGRYGHSSVIAGNYLYVVGGVGSNGDVHSIERARILPNGELGPFSAITGISLVRPRSRATTAVIGNHLYVIGGDFSPDLPETVERAPLISEDSQ
jgi:hypothetical protein